MLAAAPTATPVIVERFLDLLQQPPHRRPGGRYHSGGLTPCRPCVPALPTASAQADSFDSMKSAAVCLAVGLLVLPGCSAANEAPETQPATESSGQFEIDVWADNWSAIYVDGVKVGEDSVPITTERSLQLRDVFLCCVLSVHGGDRGQGFHRGQHRPGIHRDKPPADGRWGSNRPDQGHIFRSHRFSH